MTPEQQQWLDEIMDHFDFARVAKAMQCLRWYWGMGEKKHIPEEPELRSEARRILIFAINAKSTVATGGFCASYLSDGLSLQFVLHDFEAFTPNDPSPEPPTKQQARGAILPATKGPGPNV